MASAKLSPIMTTPLPDAAAVRRALERRFFKFGPTADEAMVIVGTVLEDRDREIARLRELAGQDGSEGEPATGVPG